MVLVLVSNRSLYDIKQLVQLRNQFFLYVVFYFNYSKCEKKYPLPESHLYLADTFPLAGDL